MVPRDSTYEYSPCKIIVAKKNGEYVEEGYQVCQDRDSHLEFQCLKMGEYRMYIEIKWNEDTEVQDRVVQATSYG